MGIEYRPSPHLAGFDKLPRADHSQGAKKGEELVTPYTMGHALKTNTEDTANPTGQLTRMQKIALYQDYHGCVNPSDEELAAFDPNNPPKKPQQPELAPLSGSEKEIFEKYREIRGLDIEKKAAENRSPEDDSALVSILFQY
jgi:hypothetical protein